MYYNIPLATLFSPLTLPFLTFGVGAEHSSAEASVWA